MVKITRYIARYTRELTLDDAGSCPGCCAEVMRIFLLLLTVDRMLSMNLDDQPHSRACLRRAKEAAMSRLQTGAARSARKRSAWTAALVVIAREISMRLGRWKD